MGAQKGTVMILEIAVAKTLEAAADTLQARGFHQGMFTANEYDENAPVCAWGAINAALGYDPAGMWERAPGSGADHAPALSVAAMTALNCHLGTSAIHWNDEPGRTADEVVAALRGAAADARAAWRP